MSLIHDPSGETIVVAIRIKKHELAECLRRIPQNGTIHDVLYNAFSFGLFAAYELESVDRDLLRRLVAEWREPYRRPNDARLIGKTDEELIRELFGTESAAAQGAVSPTPSTSATAESVINRSARNTGG